MGISKEQLEAMVVDEKYSFAERTPQLRCELTLQSGYVVWASTTCLGYTDAYKELAAGDARKKAMNKLLELMLFHEQQVAFILGSRKEGVTC